MPDAIDGVCVHGYSSFSLIKRLNPLEIYARSTSLDYFGIPCQYGGAEYCRWYGTGIVITVERWRLLTKDVSTEEVCQRLGIKYRQS